MSKAVTPLGPSNSTASALSPSASKASVSASSASSATEKRLVIVTDCSASEADEEGPPKAGPPEPAPVETKVTLRRKRKPPQTKVFKAETVGKTRGAQEPAGPYRPRFSIVPEKPSIRAARRISIKLGVRPTPAHKVAKRAVFVNTPAVAPITPLKGFRVSKLRLPDSGESHTLKHRPDIPIGGWDDRPQDPAEAKAAPPPKKRRKERRSEVFAPPSVSSEDSTPPDEEALRQRRSRRLSSFHDALMAADKDADDDAEGPEAPVFEVPPTSPSTASSSKPRRRSFVQADAQLKQHVAASKAQLRRRSGIHGDLPPLSNDDERRSPSPVKPPAKKAAAARKAPAKRPARPRRLPKKDQEEVTVPEPAKDLEEPDAPKPTKAATPPPAEMEPKPQEPSAPVPVEKPTKPKKRAPAKTKVVKEKADPNENTKAKAEDKVFPLFQKAAKPDEQSKPDKGASDKAGPTKAVDVFFDLFRPATKKPPQDALDAPPATKTKRKAEAEPTQPAKKARKPPAKKPAAPPSSSVSVIELDDEDEPDPAPPKAPAKKAAAQPSASVVDLVSVDGDEDESAAPEPPKAAGPKKAVKKKSEKVFPVFQPKGKTEEAPAEEKAGSGRRYGLRVRRHPNRLGDDATEPQPSPTKPKPKGRARKASKTTDVRKAAGKDMGAEESAVELEAMDESPPKVVKKRSPSPEREYVFAAVPEEQGPCHSLCGHVHLSSPPPNHQVQEDEDNDPPFHHIKDFLLENNFREAAPPTPKAAEDPPRQTKGQTEVLWSHSLRPRSLKDFRGNEEAVAAARRWLAGWSPPTQLPKASKREEEDEAECPDTLVLVGPVGCGKTQLAHALARDMGYTVEELGVDSVRSHKALDALAKKAKGAGRCRHIGSFFATPASSDTAAAPKRLILMDDADLVPEVDEGFAASLASLALSSQMPLILTATEELDLTFPTLSIRLAGRWTVAEVSRQTELPASLVPAAEGHDTRAALNHLHFWGAHSVAGHSLPDMPGQNDPPAKGWLRTAVDKCLGREEQAAPERLSEACVGLLELRAGLDASLPRSEVADLPGSFRGSALGAGVGERESWEEGGRGLDWGHWGSDVGRGGERLGELGRALAEGGRDGALGSRAALVETAELVAVVNLAEERRRESLSGREARRFRHYLAQSAGLDSPALDPHSRLTRLSARLTHPTHSTTTNAHKPSPITANKPSPNTSLARGPNSPDQTDA